jgi:hypothetical protein
VCPLRAVTAYRERCSPAVQGDRHRVRQQSSPRSARYCSIVSSTSSTYRVTAKTDRDKIDAVVLGGQLHAELRGCQSFESEMASTRPSYSRGWCARYRNDGVPAEQSSGRTNHPALLSLRLRWWGMWPAQLGVGPCSGLEPERILQGLNAKRLSKLRSVRSVLAWVLPMSTTFETSRLPGISASQGVGAS